MSHHPLIATKVTLSSHKELAERNLDVTTNAFSLGGPEASAMDFRSVANKVSFGTSVIDLDNQEVCPDHQNEQIIAMQTVDGKLVFGCNKCVFERKLTQPVFLAYQARQTKQRIDERYKALTQNLKDVSNLEPDILQQKICRQVSDFF